MSVLHLIHKHTLHAGLQIGYFLERSGRDYVIFEKNTTAGEALTHRAKESTTYFQFLALAYDNGIICSSLGICYNSKLV